MIEIEDLVVEYFVSINSENTFNVCTTKEAFNNLLSSNENIKINGNKISYKEIEVNYTIQLTEKENSKFFHMIFRYNEIEKLELYEEFLRGIKSVIGKISDNGVIVLWDDISVYYCKKVYPLINKVENTMRKLLTKFMMVNIGEDWDKTVISDEIKKSIAKKNNSQGNYDYLYKADFISLSEFLFKEYPNKTYENFIKEVKKLKNSNEFNIEDIIKKSNWDRYFRDIVNCEGEFLNKRWKQLYDLRCKVAHNNQLNKDEYSKIIELINEIEPKLEEVIEKLDKITIKEESKITIVENVVNNIHPIAIEFLNEYNAIENLIKDIMRSSNIKEVSILRSLDILHREEFISSSDVYKLKDLIHFRNELVHNIDQEISESEWARYILLLAQVQAKLNEICNNMNI